MIRKFFSLLLFFLVACSNQLNLIENPQKGDIYVFEESGIYSPIMVDSVSRENIYCVNSRFVFADALPEPVDLPRTDFDFSFHLIYEKAEIKRLFSKGIIVAVYRESN